MPVSDDHSELDKRLAGAGKTLTEHTLQGFFWIFSGNIAQAVLKIGATAVLARFLMPGDFGIVGAGLVVVGFCQIFSQLGVGPAIVQRPEITDTHLKVAFTLSFLMGLTTAALVMAGAPLIAAFFRMPELESVARVLALSFPITGLGGTAEALLQRRMRFREFAKLELISFAFGYCLVGVTLAYIGYGIWALVIGHIAQNLLQTILVVRASPHVRTFSLHRATLKEILFFSGGFSLARIGNFVAVQADNVVVGRWLGADALGIYGRAYQFMMLPTNLFGKVVDNVLFPSMAAVQQDPNRLARAYVTSVGIVAMITIPLSAMLVLLAPEIVNIVLGSQWMSVVVPFQILAAILVFRTSYKMSDTLVRATGAVYSRAWRQWIYGAFVFIGSYAGTRWGLAGVAAGVAVAIVVNFLLMLHLSLRLTSATWMQTSAAFMRHTITSLPVTVAAGAVVYGMRRAAMPDAFVVGAAGVVSGVVFLLMISAFGKMFGEEGAFVARICMKYFGPLKRRFRLGSRIVRVPAEGET
jgi:PST family polysaccharide transporter